MKKYRVLEAAIAFGLLFLMGVIVYFAQGVHIVIKIVLCISVPLLFLVLIEGVIDPFLAKAKERAESEDKERIEKEEREAIQRCENEQKEEAKKENPNLSLAVGNYKEDKPKPRRFLSKKEKAEREKRRRARLGLDNENN